MSQNDADGPTAGKIEYIPVDELNLDPNNPRLPEDLVGSSQPQLLAWLVEQGALEELASSMVTNGFFEHEPLVVMRAAGMPTLVVEGNRRFATLSLLLQLPAAREADLSFDFEEAPTVASLNALRSVPCLVVSSEEEVRKFLGFRHIGGLKTWSPEAKARYLEAEISRAVSEGSKAPFKDVGKRVGTNALGVRGPYLALRILRYAQEETTLRDQANYVLRERFGVWNRLLNSLEVRSYLRIEDSLTYEGIQRTLGTVDVAALARVISDLVPRDGATRPVLRDSRDATRYGRVLASDAARATLVATDDIGLAYQVVDRESLSSRLANQAKAIEIIIAGVDSFEVTPEVVSTAQSLSSSARSLLVILRDRLDGDD